MPDTNVDEVGGEVDESAGPPAPQPPDAKAAPAAKLPEVPAHLGRDLTLYTLVRFGLIAVVAVLLVLLGVPLLVALPVGLVVAVLVAMLLLRGWHNRVSAGLAARGAVRAAARNRLRAELRGELEGDDTNEPGSRDTVGDDRTSDGKAIDS